VPNVSFFGYSAEVIIASDVSKAMFTKPRQMPQATRPRPEISKTNRLLN